MPYALDPSTPVGKVRLRIGDWSDLQLLPDVVITSALDDCAQSIPRASQLCSQYILATLTAKTHKKLANVEMWSSEQFANYVQFLKLTILNPAFMAVAPIPYVGAAQVHPLIAFQQDWKAGYLPGAQVVPYGTYPTPEGGSINLAPVIVNVPS